MVNVETLTAENAALKVKLARVARVLDYNGHVNVTLTALLRAAMS